jgi:iron complex outermembrane receptor protein
MSRISVAPTHRSLRLSIAAILALSATATAVGAEPADSGTPVTTNGDQVNLGTVGAASGAAMEIVVVAQRDSVAAIAPVQANLSAIEPQTVISRAFIEDSVPPTGTFNSILTIAPGVTTQPSPNGPGLADTTTVIRGFQDNQYNVTWDGIPFGDTNDPSHHSTAYFPSGVIGGAVIERGPGNASNLGQSTFGGSVNLFSKTPSDSEHVDVYGSYGSWDTKLYGLGYESGKIASLDDATFQFNYQGTRSRGYLTYNDLKGDNAFIKFRSKVATATTLTAFATYNSERQGLSDGSNGATLAQAALFGKSYDLNNDPNSQGYYRFNQVHKTTDMEYIRLQTDWGGGVQTDNNLYSYYYDNQTLSGDDSSGYLGVGNALDPNAQPNGTAPTPTSTAPNDVPGYFKLNHYRVTGDIFKATLQTDPGLLRGGIWAEQSYTHREINFVDLTTGGPDYSQESPPAAFPSTPDNLKYEQWSSWKQFQPFAEFEWAAGPGLTVTPGIKYLHFTRTLDAPINQGSREPDYVSETFTHTIPYLTVNQRFGDSNSAYLQFAQGFQIPILENFQVKHLQVVPTNAAPAPQTTTNYQVGFVHKDSRFTWDADVYYINFNNIIEQTNSPAGTAVYFNGGGAVYKGLEGEATLQLDAGFALFASGGLIRAQYKAGNATYSNDNNQLAVGGPLTGNIPLVPQSTLAGGLLYKSHELVSSLIYNRVGAQNMFGDQNAYPQYDVKAYANVDWNTSYTFHDLTPGLSKLKLQLSVFNLANSRQVTYITPGAQSPTLSNDEYQWQAPRSYMVSFRATF